MVFNNNNNIINIKKWYGSQLHISTHSMAPILMIMHLSIVYLHQREEQEYKRKKICGTHTIITNFDNSNNKTTTINI
jgi:hypothetical protein